MRNISICLVLFSAASFGAEGWDNTWFQGYDDGTCYMTGVRNVSAQNQSALLPNITAAFLAIRKDSHAQHPVLADLQIGELAFIVTVPKQRKGGSFYPTVSALELDGVEVTDVIDDEHTIAFRAREPLSRQVLDKLKDGSVVTMYAQTVEDIAVDISISPPGADQFSMNSKMFEACASDGA